MPEVPEPNAQAIEIVFRPDPTIGDGRWANNAWLQELPKPLSKVTWDNPPIALSPATAWRLGLTTGDIATLSNGGWQAAGPVYATPGQADNSATVTLGYGRKRAGNVGSGIGVNGYLLRTSSAPAFGKRAADSKGRQELSPRENPNSSSHRPQSPADRGRKRNRF